MTRRFQLIRETDVTGISGCGVVADGILFDDGSAAMRWRSKWTSTAIYELGMTTIEAIHGHGGSTVIKFLDGE